MAGWNSHVEAIYAVFICIYMYLYVYLLYLCPAYVYIYIYIPYAQYLIALLKCQQGIAMADLADLSTRLH